MPICAVDRKRLGSDASASARLAPLRPSWARALRRERRDETTASSESANSPLRAMRTSTTAISNTAMRPVQWLAGPLLSIIWSVPTASKGTAETDRPPFDLGSFTLSRAMERSKSVRSEGKLTRRPKRGVNASNDKAMVMARATGLEPAASGVTGRTNSFHIKGR